MLNHITLRPHDQIAFGLLNGRWDVVGETRDGRYVLVTNTPARTYQIIDREQGFRGALTGGPVTDLGPTAPSFDIDSPKDHARYILDQLEDGRDLALPSLMPLWITRHWTSDVRGPVLDPEKLSEHACHRIDHWLKTNGCRWVVPPSAVVRIKGRHIEVDAWTIRNPHQSQTLWPKHVDDNWEPAEKRRRFRIRVPLSTIRKARP